MNVLSDDVRNRWVEGSSYQEENTFTELFAQKILDEGLKQYSPHIRNESDFLKYNYSLLGNTGQ